MCLQHDLEVIWLQWRHQVTCLCFVVILFSDMVHLIESRNINVNLGAQMTVSYREDMNNYIVLCTVLRTDLQNQHEDRYLWIIFKE